MSEEVLSLSFSSDHRYLSVGSNSGFRIFSVEPFALLSRSPEGNFRLVERFEQSKVLFLVGAGEHPAYSPRRLTLWDMEHCYVMREALFPDTVLRVLTNHLRVIAVTRKALYLYNTATMNPTVLPTVDNPRGLASLSPYQSGNCLVFPSSEAVGNFKLYDAVTMNQQAEIEAHKNPLAALTLSQDGVLCATASVRGTVIRVFSLYTLEKLYSYKRGMGAVELEYLSFALSAPVLISCSSSGTVHLFKLREEHKKSWGSSFFRKMSAIATTVMPESFSDSIEAPKSFMHIRTNHEVQARAVMLANPDRLFVVNFKGLVQLYNLNLERGESTLLQETSLFSSSN